MEFPKAPENMEEWWNLVNKYKHNLIQIAGRFRYRLEEPLKEKLVTAIDEEDSEEVHHLLEELWWAAPDVSDLHFIPGWGALCDLCSEFSCCFESELSGGER